MTPSGSAAHSDIDFLVEFGSQPELGTLQTYFGLKDALEAALFLFRIDWSRRDARKS